MIDNRLISSKAVIAKCIADLDMPEDKIRISDWREWIIEGMLKIGALQQFEHKVAILDVHDYQAALPCDLYKLGQVAFSFDECHYWLPMRKTTNSFGVFKYCDKHCKPKMYIHDTALLPMVKNIFNLTNDADALKKLNENENIRHTLGHLINHFTIPSSNGRLIPGNPAAFNTSLQYSTKPGYINVNVPCGKLKIAYYAIPTDEDSMPLIPDLESYKDALLWYIATKHYYPQYLKGQINANVYQDMKRSWAYYRNAAYGEAMMPGVDDMRSIQNNWLKLYPEIDEHDSFFEFLGDEQQIYNQDN